MSTTIQIKRSSTASAVPLTGDLEVGELAINLADKRLFTKKSDGTIVELSTNPTDIDIATLRIDGVEVTASAAELNSLDGSTASTADLNKLAAITATATELNVLDGFTGSTAELNLLDGVTATTAELNFVDGVTSNVQTQLNAKQPLDAQLTDIAGLTPTDGSFIVGNGVNFVAESGNTAIASLGVTATAAELNTLDGITASTTELNYTDGVTSNIQTQLNGKAATTTSPTITLAGDLSGSATLTNLGSATLTATVADDSHNHVISNVDGLQTALDSKANLSGANFTGSVDVTGTVTADGLTVDGSSDQVTVNGTNNNGATLLFLKDSNVNGTGLIHYNSAHATLADQTWIKNYTASGSIFIAPNNQKSLELSSNGDVSFYEDTGTTAKMVWDASAENITINHEASSLNGFSIKNSTSTGATTGAGLTLHAYDGSSTTQMGGMFVSNSSWNYGTYSPKQLCITGSGSGGVRLASTAAPIQFHTGNANAGLSSERMRIDSAGNVGIGTNSPISIGGHSGVLTLYGSNATALVLQDSTSRKDLRLDNGDLSFRNSSGDTHLMVKDGGNVGIGTASPASKLDIVGLNKDAIKIRSDVAPENYYQIGRNQSTGLLEFFGSEATYNGYLFKGNASDLMVINSAGNVGIGTGSPTNKISVSGNAGLANGIASFNSSAFTRIYGDATHGGNVNWNTGGALRFAISNDDFSGYTEKARIDSSGNLLVGKTSDSGAVTTDGINLRAGGYSTFTATSKEALQLSRQGVDGDILAFYKGSAVVGTIGVKSSSDPYFAGSAVGKGIYLNGNGALPCNGSGAPTDAGGDLGQSSVRWRDLYLSGGVYLGGTGAANKLDDYEEGTWTPSAESNITIPTVNNATYTRVGDTVTINAWFTAYASNASFAIGGLPYAISGRTTASLSNIFESEVISNQVLSTSIYGYGVTISGIQRDWFLSFSYKI